MHDDLVSQINCIGPFDVLVYAYLKEELINCPYSNEAKHLQKTENLMKFIKLMDELLISDSKLGKTLIKNNKITVKKEEWADVEKYSIKNQGRNEWSQYSILPFSWLPEFLM